MPEDSSAIIKYISREKDIKKVDKIYIRMYGNKYINSNKGKELDKIISIQTSEIDFWNDKSSFIYIWGWPGPDYNVYRYSDYGETWAFYPWELEGEIMLYEDEEIVDKFINIPN